MATKPTLTAPPVDKPSKYGNDPEAFDAAMQADINWLHDHWHPDQTAAVDYVEEQMTAAAGSASAAQSDRILAQAGAAAVAAANPATNAAAAAISAAAAAVSASLAQATNPDSPIRLNTREITANFTVGAAYNAASAGPITISDGVTVTVADNATWSVH
jgi:hypothetical protein